MRARVGQFGRFVVIGLVATGIQYGVLVASVELLGWRSAVGSGVGFVLSAVANYLLNYRFTFQSTRAHTSAASRFMVVAGVGLLLNIGLMALFTDHWHLAYLLAQVLVTGITLVWNFCGNAFWSFTHSDKNEPARTAARGSNL